MELTVTATIAGAMLALTLLASWQAGRPRKDSLRERWVPWRFVILLSGAVLLLSVVHLVNLMGFVTGQGAPRF
jgi:hypothetical protein